MKAKLTRVGPFGVKTDQHGDKWVGNGKGKYEKVSNLQENFHAGDTVEIEVKENGQYLNLESLKVLEKGTGSSGEPAHENTSGTRHNGPYPKETARKDGLAIAAALVSASKTGDLSQMASDVKGLGQEFATYIMTGSFNAEEPQQEKK